MISFHFFKNIQLTRFLVILLVSSSINAGEWVTYPLRDNGTVPIWLVAGMLPNRPQGIHHDAGCLGFYKDFLTANGGEINSMPAEGNTIVIEDEKIIWRRAFSDQEGLIDFNHFFNLKTAKSVVAYAFCRIVSPTAQQVMLKIRSDDGVRVWINQQFVHEVHEPRGVDEAEDNVLVRLEKGENRLLLKIDQGEGGWGMGFRIVSPLAQRLDDLSVKVELVEALPLGLWEIQFTTNLPLISPKGNYLLPIEMELVNSGLQDLTLTFSNEAWKENRLRRYQNLTVGRFNDQILLDLPAEQIKGLIQVQVQETGKKELLYRAEIKPFSYGNLFLSSPQIYVIPSSHQDIAWMDTPQQCIDDRDKLIITPALDLLRRNPAYHYDIEDVLIIKEYLERHPERRDEINHYCREGRLLIAGSYTQPYESLNSGEALVRQLYFGRRWLKENLPGCDCRVVYSPDVPGRAIQMPQILNKSGIDYLVLSRFDPGFFKWRSPDSSGIIAYSMGHYGYEWQVIMKNVHNLSTYLTDQYAFLDKWESFYQAYHLKPIIPLLASYDMSIPFDFSPLQSLFENLSDKLYTTKGIVDHELKVPRYATSQKVLDLLIDRHTPLPEFQGERPNIWLYIHGPTHHKAISAAREAAVLLPAAEKFNLLYALLKNNLKLYPQTELNNGWESLIYPDHGWGGKNGEITDYVFYTKYEQARILGKVNLYQALRGISEMIKLPEDREKAMIVFNDQSWLRSEIVNSELHFLPGELAYFRIEDYQKNTVPYQVIAEERNRDGSINKMQISFLARDVTAIGYQTYFIVPEKSAAGSKNPPQSCEILENNFYKIQLTNGGIRQIYDKKLKKDLLNTSKFLGGEIFVMGSEGNGAGEFSEVQQPTMDGFDKISNYANEWHLVSAGSVATTYQLQQRLEHATILQSVTIYNEKKQIDFDSKIIDWDGTKNLELRQAFPINMHKAQIAYEVPFGQVRVGKDEIKGAAGERYVQECAAVHPREVQNWMSCSDQQLKLTLSSSVAVMDWLDPTANPVEYPILQPLLLASRKSCHGEGNWYLQKGTHDFHFSLFSGSLDTDTESLAVGVNHPFQAVLIYDSSIKNQTLPLKMGFVACDNNNIVISSLKKSEDDDRIVLRCYEKGMQESKVTFDFFRDLQTAEKTNLIEEEGQPISLRNGDLTVKLRPWAIETFKFSIASQQEID